MQPARLWREVAPGTLATLHALTDPEKRPPLPRSPIPEDLIDPQPRVLFNFCEDTICHQFAFGETWSCRWPVRHDGRAFAHLVDLRTRRFMRFMRLQLVSRKPICHVRFWSHCDLVD